MNKLALTPEETARALGISSRTLQRWRKQGTGPAFIKIGNTIRYQAKEIETWLQQNATNNLK